MKPTGLKSEFVPVICLISFVTALITFNAIGIGVKDVNGENQFIYGCTRAANNNTHCDPVPGKFTSFRVQGEADEVYDITDSTFGWVPAKIGGGLPLRGYIDQFLTVKNSPSLDSKVFSISMWIKQDPDFDIDGTLLAHTDRTNTAGWKIGIRVKPEPMLDFTVTNTHGQSFTASVPVDRDKFELVTGTFDGTTVKLYLNGALADSASYSGIFESNPESPFNMGVDSFEHTNAWKGIIDEVRLYDIVLTAAQIKELYSGDANISQGLVGYWPFDNDSNDHSGNGNDGAVASQAVSLAFAPDGRLFISEKNIGEIRILKDDKILAEPFVKLNGSYVAQHQGFLGITIDPKFEINHYVYLYYTSKSNNTDLNINRLVRFTELNNKGTEEKVLIDNIPASPEGEFAGGALAFGPDDKLYISVGHANSLDLPQNISSLIGKVLRINRDGSIPSDNPFPNSPVFTYGHRNIFGIAFDKKSGIGIVTENGDAHYDEINVLKKGGNYGFSTTQPPTMSPLLDNSSSIKPIRTYWHTIAPTQAIFYDGNRFVKLKDKLLFGSYNQGFIYALGLNSTEFVTDELAIEFPYDDKVDSIAQSPSGDIYFGGYKIYRVKSINQDQPQELIHFIELSSNSATFSHLSMDAKNTSLTFDVKASGSQTSASPSIVLKIPKVLLSGINEVTSNPLPVSNGQVPIKKFDIKQQFRSSDIGDTIVIIGLNSGAEGSVTIKGTGASFTG